jgi:hypothetical protein
MPAIALQLRAMAVQFLEQIALQIGPRGHIHDLEDRGQRKVVIHRCVALHELAQPVEQMLQPKHRADAFVERILVEDQIGLGCRAGRTAC